MTMARSDQLVAEAWRGIDFDPISAKRKLVVLFVKIWLWSYKKLFDLSL